MWNIRISLRCTGEWKRCSYVYCSQPEMCVIISTNNGAAAAVWSAPMVGKEMCAVMTTVHLNGTDVLYTHD